MYVQVTFVRNGLVYVNKLHGIRAIFNQLNQIQILSVSVSVTQAHYSLRGTALTYVSATDHTKPELISLLQEPHVHSDFPPQRYHQTNGN